MKRCRNTQLSSDRCQLATQIHTARLLASGIYVSIWLEQNIIRSLTKTVAGRKMDKRLARYWRRLTYRLRMNTALAQVRLCSET